MRLRCRDQSWTLDDQFCSDGAARSFTTADQSWKTWTRPWLDTGCVYAGCGVWCIHQQRNGKAKHSKVNQSRAKQGNTRQSAAKQNKATPKDCKQQRNRARYSKAKQGKTNQSKAEQREWKQGKPACWWWCNLVKWLCHLNLHFQDDRISNCLLMMMQSEPQRWCCLITKFIYHRVSERFQNKTEPHNWTLLSISKGFPKVMMFPDHLLGCFLWGMFIRHRVLKRFQSKKEPTERRSPWFNGFGRSWCCAIRSLVYYFQGTSFTIGFRRDSRTRRSFRTEHRSPSSNELEKTMMILDQPLFIREDCVHIRVSERFHNYSEPLNWTSQVIIHCIR